MPAVQDSPLRGEILDARLRDGSYAVGLQFMAMECGSLLEAATDSHSSLVKASQNGRR
jgi:hypothetical protein